MTHQVVISAHKANHSVHDGKFNKGMPAINVAKLDFCYEDACSFSEDLHLTVEIEQVELEKSHAVATSYTWGEFDRRDVPIGHFLRRSSDPVLMNLGQEWNIEDLISTLASICIGNREEHGQEHASVWIDQLCIPQTTDQIRNALASIPSIYRTLNVVVLMPGSLCGCLRQMNNYKELKSKSVECLNAVGTCSYFFRQWTRQEMLYSGSVQLVRTSSEEAHCVNSPDDAHHLSAFNKLRLTQYHNDKDESSSWMRLRLEQVDFLLGASLAFDWVHGGEKERKAYEFLMGQRITKQPPPYEVSDIVKFLHSLTDQAMNPRQATKPRDYVLSVWVDCPGYNIPHNFREMDLADLLEDAVLQLERNHGVTVQTTAVAGLFGDCSSGSVTWRPTKYLRYTTISASHQVYSVVCFTTVPMRVQPDGEALLYIPSSSSTPLSKLAREYSDIFSWQDAVSVANALEPVISNWSNTMLSNLMSRTTIRRDISPASALIESRPDWIRFAAGLLSRVSATRDIGLGRMPPIPHILPTTDHYSAVYLMVTLALGLDFELCLSLGLKLMVVLERHPCIGLMNMESGASPDMITIRAGEPGVEGNIKQFGDILYEGIMQKGSGITKYRVCGIWVPFGHTSRFEPGGFIVGGGVLG
jgi:hypothetical protein